MEGFNISLSRFADLIIDQKVSLRLKKGDELNGKVLKILRDGLTLMDFGKFRAKASVKVPVKPGDQFRLTVVQAKNPLVLSVAGEKDSPLDLGRGAPLGEKSYISGSIKQTLSAMDTVLKSDHAGQKSLFSLPPSFEKEISTLSDVIKKLGEFVKGDLFVKGAGQKETGLKKPPSILYFKEGSESLLKREPSDSLLLNKGRVPLAETGAEKERGALLRVAVDEIIQRMKVGDLPKQKDIEVLKSSMTRLGERVTLFTEETLKSRVGMKNGQMDVSQMKSKEMPVQAETFLKNSHGLTRQLNTLVKDLDWLHLPKETPQKNLETTQTLPKIIARILSNAGQVKGEGRIPDVVKDALLNVMKHFTPPSDPSETKEIPKPIGPPLPVPTPEKGEAIAHVLKRIMEDSGQVFEKKAEEIITRLMEGDKKPSPEELLKHPLIKSLFKDNLKPNLLIIKNFLDEADITLSKEAFQRLEPLKKGVALLLNEEHRQQYESLENKREGKMPQSFSFFMPMKFQQADEGVRLKVFYNEKESEGKGRPPQVSILLDLDRIGAIRADLVMIAKDLAITFFVRDHLIEAWVKAHLNEVEDVLSRQFNFITIRVNVSEKKITEFDSDVIEKKEKGMVDIKV